MTAWNLPRYSFPAQAGTQGCSVTCLPWTPAFAGEEIEGFLPGLEFDAQ
jgi:hypothetical protein